MDLLCSYVFNVTSQEQQKLVIITLFLSSGYVVFNTVIKKKIQSNQVKMKLLNLGETVCLKISLSFSFPFCYIISLQITLVYFKSLLCFLRLIYGYLNDIDLHSDIFGVHMFVESAFTAEYSMKSERFMSPDTVNSALCSYIFYLTRWDI